MREKIKITCPGCHHKWEQYLDELERVEGPYRLTSTYRALCPKDGTYVIIEVKEVADDRPGRKHS